MMEAILDITVQLLLLILQVQSQLSRLIYLGLIKWQATGMSFKADTLIY